MSFLDELFEAAIVDEDSYAEVQILLCETTYRKGDKNALFKLLVLCARYQAVIPDWATDELIKIENGLISGEIKDFNIVFGKLIEPRVRKKIARLDSTSLKIASEMLEQRKASGSPESVYSREYMFDTVSVKLGVGRRDVEHIFQANKVFFDKVPIGDSLNTYSFAQVPKELPIRRGRKMFKD